MAKLKIKIEDHQVEELMIYIKSKDLIYQICNYSQKWDLIIDANNPDHNEALSFLMEESVDYSLS